MAKKLEPRIESIEDYLPMFYQWIDELRAERLEMQKDRLETQKWIKESKEIFKQNEIQILRLADIQSMMARLLERMNDKLDDHEKHISGSQK